MCASRLNRCAVSCVNRGPCGDVSTTVSGWPRVGLDRVERPEHRVRLQHHPRSAAVRHVVHDPMAIGREVAQVVHLDVEQTALDRPADHAGRERLLEHRRKNRDDVERHGTRIGTG